MLSMSGDSRGYIASDLNDLGYQLISKDPSEELIVTFKAEVPYHPLEIRVCEISFCATILSHHLIAR